MKKIVVLTGAGISAESGIRTFRDANGLWEEYRIEEVATYNAWLKNRSLVLDFYNQRRRQLGEVAPNAAHIALAKLQEKFFVQIITQNVDDLHERAGSKQILHLHGELTKVRSTVNDNYILDIGYRDLNEGDLCPLGSQLRPHIVWFGEAVPNIMEATIMVQDADVVMVIGTSLNVYPAAGLMHYAKSDARVYYIDPDAKAVYGNKKLIVLKQKAGVGVPELVDELMMEQE